MRQSDSIHLHVAPFNSGFRIMVTSRAGTNPAGPRLLKGKAPFGIRFWCETKAECEHDMKRLREYLETLK